MAKLVKHFNQFSQPVLKVCIPEPRQSSCTERALFGARSTQAPAALSVQAKKRDSEPPAVPPPERPPHEVMLPWLHKELSLQRNHITGSSPHNHS